MVSPYQVGEHSENPLLHPMDGKSLKRLDMV